MKALHRRNEHSEDITNVLEWIVPAAAFIGVYFLGRHEGRRAAAASLRDTSRAQAADRASYLATLRRELANIMVWQNPQRYLQLYRELNDEVSSLKSRRAESVRSQLQKLREKYPRSEEFDLIGSREYVLTSDGWSSFATYEDLEVRYRDLVMFTALSAVTDKTFRWDGYSTSDGELKLLTDYVQKVEDTKLYLRLDRAMDDYYMQSRYDDEEDHFSNDFYTIDNLHGSFENRYSIHLKRTNEFGIYSFFVHDDGHTTKHYYRSNTTFEVEEGLQPLKGVIDAIQLER